MREMYYSGFGLACEIVILAAHTAAGTNLIAVASNVLLDILVLRSSIRYYYYSISGMAAMSDLGANCENDFYTRNLPNLPLFT